jgi:class 3 adenylate cyclase
VSEHTFLFADLVGFTALTDLEGDDRAADVALGLHECARRQLAPYRAEEIKTLGDGIVLRCDQAGDGIALALRIVEELESVARFPPVRVGVHTGPAVRREGDWYGRTVNVAARLCSAAAGGEVLVSDHAREAAGELSAVDYSDRRLHWLRNVTEPIAAHVAMSTAPAAAPPAHLAMTASLAPATRARRCAMRRLLVRQPQVV